MYLTAVSGVGGRFASVGLVALFGALDAGPLAIAAAYAASILVDDLITIVLLRGHLRFTLRVDRVRMRGLVAAALPLGGGHGAQPAVLQARCLPARRPGHR